MGEIAKFGVGIVASIGGTTVAQAVLKTLRPDNLSKMNKILYGVGSIVIGSAVGTACARETDRIIDTIGSLFGHGKDEEYEV